MISESKQQLLQEEFFYHVTLGKNWPSIKKEGLSLRHWDRDTYALTQKRAAIYLCTAKSLPRAKQMKDEGMVGNPLVVIRIPADAVVNQECDVDRSYPEATEGMDLAQCLGQVGFIACYGSIPPQSLTLTEHQDESGCWQEGE